MNKYCYECGKEVKTKVITKKETYKVCGEPVEVEAKILVCAECGEELFCEELDNKTLVTAYNLYRRRHRLLLPEEIRKIREQYGLSQRSFARLLNWGDKTIFRYENGSIQDKVHNSLLLFLRRPENMKIYIEENEISLDERQKKRLLENLARLQNNEKSLSGKKITAPLFNTRPCEENGFKAFDYDKFCDMVLFFAHKMDGLLKTKLMKLLDYSDMIYYKENGISMSGARYAHLPYGPVPENYDLLFGAMAEDHVVHIQVVYDNGYEKHQVVPEKEVSRGSFTEKELAVLEKVYEKFRDFGSGEISDYSHKEKGYMETETGKIISYAYAKDICLD